MHAFYEHRTYKYNLPIYVDIRENIDFLAHWHNEVEFIYILEGKQKVGINQEIQTLEKGDMAICGSGDIHYYAGSDDTANQIMTIFKPDLIGYAANWPQQLRFASPIIKRSCFSGDFMKLSKIDEIEKLFLDIYEEYDKEQICYVDSIKSKLLEICVLLIRNFPTINTENANDNHRQYNLERMQKALQFIDENFTGELSLEDLAENSNVSYYHFSRLFKNTMGMNFKEYLSRKRIQHADFLLEKGGISVTQAAFESGFDSVRSFHRTYKAIKGFTPGKSKK